MRISSTCILGLLLTFGIPLKATTNHLYRRVLKDPVGRYLNSVCLPNLSNLTRRAELRLSQIELFASLGTSPFPCEQVQYILLACCANGTNEIDFLAEQQCLCNGAFFEVLAGCNQCFLAHGWQPIDRSPEQLASRVSSLSIAECAPTPPFQPFANIYITTQLNITSIQLAPPITLGTDHFPNITDISNYYTATQTNLLGEITGSATARRTSYTNYDGVRFTPTSVPVSSGTGSFVADSTSQASTTPTAVSTTTGGNAAGRSKAQVTAGLLVAVLGVVALL
jgi:hypothetical protein